MRKTEVNPIDYPFSISHDSKVLFLGSCFAETISEQMKQRGFHVLANPFGVLFHPYSLAKVIKSSLNEEALNESIVQREDVFLSWCANSNIYAMRRDDMAQRLYELSNQLKMQLATSNVLFLTFGTAWEYLLKEEGSHVANCHKFPSALFEKKLSTVQELEKQFSPIVEVICKINPSIQLVLTVSPVRHSKDGLVENSRSKARLIELVHALVEKYKKVTYFPAYELVLDELRDYAYYKEDGVHPNQQAINYVWHYFASSFFDTKTQALAERFLGLVKLKQHKPIHKESKAAEAFKASIAKKREALQKEAPQLDFNYLHQINDV